METATLTTSPVADPYPGQGVVLYDGACPLCRRSIAVVKKLDWFHRLAYQDCRDPGQWPPSEQKLEMKRLLEEMHVVTPDRRRAHAGYAAFRWIAWRLPLAWPVAPLLYIPGVTWLGNRVYLWVAKRRFDLVPCQDGTCQLHSPS